MEHIEHKSVDRTYPALILYTKLVLGSFRPATYVCSAKTGLHKLRPH